MLLHKFLKSSIFLKKFQKFSTFLYLLIITGLEAFTKLKNCFYIFVTIFRNSVINTQNHGITCIEYVLPFLKMIYHNNNLT